MRSHITSGKESQSSLINYKKGGKPFINLVTMCVPSFPSADDENTDFCSPHSVPIAWDTDEIAYYVGFQVDLVDQPNAILDRMKDGTYVVNYSLLNNPPKSISMQAIQANEVEDWAEEKVPVRSPPTIMVVPDKERELPRMTQNLSLSLETDGDESQVVDILHKLDRGVLTNDKDKKQLNKFLLNNVRLNPFSATTRTDPYAQSDDFIHVLSLKGSMLYCSPSSAQILEYSPSELVGKTLSALCHPSDVVPVLRELKESGSVSHSHVSLLYRIRRKHSGYIWIEATGKLHSETLSPLPSSIRSDAVPSRS
jgi:PAS domain S-box-containing protein